MYKKLWGVIFQYMKVASSNSDNRFDWKQFYVSLVAQVGLSRHSAS